MPASNETPEQIAAAVSMASIICKGCALDGAKQRLGATRALDVLSLFRPGTLIWTDPVSGEERWSGPDSVMYSTALMLATEVINMDGCRVPWPDGIPDLE
jgi:hypothetical protein